MILKAVMLVFVPLLLAFAAASDLVTMTISNRVSLLLIAAFVVVAPFSGMPWTMIGWHALAALTVLTVTFSMFAMGWMGGGDAKLTTAVALWFGFGSLMDFLLLASVLGGGLTLLLLQYRTLPLPARVAGWDWSRRLHEPTTGIPYGIALSAAALIVLPWTAVWRLVFAV